MGGAVRELIGAVDRPSQARYDQDAGQLAFHVSILLSR
jgi:hypothetical protein